MPANLKVVAGCVLLTALSASIAHGAVVVVDSSSGLFSPNNVVGGTERSVWLADNRSSSANGGDPAAWLVLDVNDADTSAVALATMNVFNWADGFSPISRLHVSYSADPNYATAVFSPVGDFDLLGPPHDPDPGSTGNDTNPNTPTVIPLGVTAQFIRIDTLRIDYGGSAQNVPLAADSPNFYGLAELQLVPGSVPEPASLTLLGAGALGLLGRRRR
jgi:hypothetical protein